MNPPLLWVNNFYIINLIAFAKNGNVFKKKGIKKTLVNVS